MTAEINVPERLLGGDPAAIKTAFNQLKQQKIDQLRPHDEAEPPDEHDTTLAAPFSITGPGTFFGRAQRTLQFEPAPRPGWWLDRIDLPDELPIEVSVRNVWTIVRNIVLRSGSPHNYMRMVEHIIALKTGLGLDNVIIRMDSGDPPLFDDSSRGMVEAVEKAGLKHTGWKAKAWTVKEPVCIGGDNGSFLAFYPDEKASRRLEIDCAIRFKSAIGSQRIQFTVNREAFRHGAFARTNCPLSMMLYCRTIGMLFADMRNLGYNTRNILVHGRWGYLNKPRMLHEGKALEAVWHRACLDMLAAVALIDRGRFAGRIVSYKAGHALDVQMIRELYQHDLLVEV